MDAAAPDVPFTWAFGMNETGAVSSPIQPMQLFDFETDSVLSFLWSSLKPEYKMAGANVLNMINTPGNVTEMIIQVSYKVSQIPSVFQKIHYKSSQSI